jgi:hypothetical protein
MEQPLSGIVLRRSAPRPAATALLAWVVMIGVDLFLHAGLLAPLYDWDSPFLLTPLEAFVRIPAGYLAFAILAAGLVWLLPRLAVEGAKRGALAGGSIGAVGWGALLLGIWSISSADAVLLAAWWLGQTASMAAAGMMTGAAIAGAGLRRLSVAAGSALVLGAVTAVLLQSIGYATPPVVIGS